MTEGKLKLLRNGKEHTKPMELIKFGKLISVLEQYGKDVAENYKDQLIQNDSVASQKLLNSVSSTVVVGSFSYKVNLSLEEYWKYVEYGSKPH